MEPARSAVWEIPAVEKRILVVDDDLHSREGLRDSLQTEGFRIETVGDAWEAIRKVKEKRFDIAIIDLDLPPVHGMTLNGWDLARIFRAYHPAISLIVVSARDSDGVRAEAEQMRILQFLEKPISPSRLKTIVKTLNS
jgi:DNA-binding response OmpR family regulator